MTILRRLLAVLLASTVAVLLPSGAIADPPQRLADQVTDRAGVLTGDRQPIDAALTRLRADTGIQLFVVFVRSYDGVPRQQWTDETARLSDLGDRDFLLTVATADRAYATSIPDGTEVSTGEEAAVARNDIEPALTRGDWAGAVVAAADGYRSAATGSSTSLVWVVVLIVAIVAGGMLWVLVRRRQRRPGAAPRPAPPAGPSVEELTARANALLIELDDDLRASERELELATAEYGTDATARFRAALDVSKENVAEAFRLRMTLDEAPAPDEATRRRTLTAIISNCTAADERLDAESEDFDRLRDLEGRAAEVADEVDRRRAEVEAALPAAADATRDLLSRYAGTTVTGVSTNVEQARERLTFAAEALTRARTALASGPSGEQVGAAGKAAEPLGAVSAPARGVPGGPRAEAALAVRAAEEAVDQAEQLIAAVHQAGTDLAAARAAADALIAELEGEIAAGHAAMDGGATSPQALGVAVARAEQAVADVRAELSGPRYDPVASVAGLQAADSALDRALAEARDAAERSARARNVLAQALPVARAQVEAASSFITTRRGAVDASARAALSEAQRHLALAESLAGTDPAAAVVEAQRAHELASSASMSARADVQSWGGPGGGFDAGSFAGAVLGGILAGGARGGGGGWGRSGGWGGGGYGGSASRGRRTGGGGRHGGGGRF